MTSTKYRSMNLIIQTILEGVLRADRENPYIKKGIVKSNLIKYASLKTTTAEKYFEQMEKAGYIQSRQEEWGQRTITIYEVTEKGKKRYEWFVQINAELNND